MIKPLRTGEPAGDLSTVFDAGTLARVTGVDRGHVRGRAAEGHRRHHRRGQARDFVGLGDQSGNLVLVTASVAFTVDGRISGVKAPLHIEQQGDLVLAPDGETWKATSYRMAVTRSGGGERPRPSTPATTKGSK